MGQDDTGLRGRIERVNERLPNTETNLSYGVAPLPAVAAFGVGRAEMAPMQASAVVDTLVAEVAPFLELFFAIGAVALVYFALGPIFKALASFRSSKSGKQGDVGEYAVRGIALLIGAAIWGMMPDLLSTMGVSYFDGISSIDVITGGS